MPGRQELTAPFQELVSHLGLRPEPGELHQIGLLENLAQSLPEITFRQMRRKRPEHLRRSTFSGRNGLHDLQVLAKGVRGTRVVARHLPSGWPVLAFQPAQLFQSYVIRCGSRRRWSCLCLTRTRSRAGSSAKNVERKQSEEQRKTRQVRHQGWARSPLQAFDVFERRVSGWEEGGHVYKCRIAGQRRSLNSLDRPHERKPEGGNRLAPSSVKRQPGATVKDAVGRALELFDIQDPYAVG